MNSGKNGSINKDCFAYKEDTKKCMALNALFCKKEACAFYKKVGKKG